MEKRGFVLSILMSLLCVAAASSALNMEYISPEQADQLVREFESAKIEKADSLLNKKWTCDMFGMRSRMQVQRGINLYSLKQGDAGVIRNTGAQPLSEYSNQGQGLVGKNPRFEDQLRMTMDGHLISRLTVLKPEPVVVAYSVCKAQ